VIYASCGSTSRLASGSGKSNANGEIVLDYFRSLGSQHNAPNYIVGVGYSVPFDERCRPNEVNAFVVPGKLGSQAPTGHTRRRPFRRGGVEIGASDALLLPKQTKLAGINRAPGRSSKWTLNSIAIIFNATLLMNRSKEKGCSRECAFVF
jgi:hypothetical protein